MTASSSRLHAVQTASERKPRFFPRPSATDGSPLPVSAYYGQNTFGYEQLRQRLPAETYRRFLDSIEQGHTLTPKLADAIASAVLGWAMERGVSHFCHWFQPMTGATAEKHDAFIAFDQHRPLARFTGSMLIQSEPDASSFPSGGMRSTFEARGYTAWDPTSPMFIMELSTGATLCIPSAFVSYHGDALDEKTPVLRSMDAINTAAVRLCRALGDSATRVIPTAGPEQEYFLVDRAYLALRPDLQLCGRTVLGARAPKGQTLEDHYFGTIPRRVLAFMQELELELYKLGVPAKTRHNEVAPSQFEIAVLYAEANVAADHNQLVMELIKRVAERHDFGALLHEKPYAGVNGSGKHLNWSMQDDKGTNLLEPGATPQDNLRFLAVLASVLLGVYRHGALLRASIASHQNDFRLGANEAPPAIISVFLGEQLEAVCNALSSGTPLSGAQQATHIPMGVASLPSLARDTTDRNRTSPFAFTGNKFEFRAVGASMSVSFPLTCVNLVVAEGMRQVAEWIEEAGGGPEAVMEVVRRALVESSPIRFEGNNYDPAWTEEAERRGLPHLRTTPAALEVLHQDGIRDLFARHKVLSGPELESRYHIRNERYITTVDIEADLLRDLVDQQVLPAALEQRTSLAHGIAALADAYDVSEDREALQNLVDQINAVRAGRRQLGQLLNEAHNIGGHEKAAFYGSRVNRAIAELRASCDALEAMIADDRWPLPRYRELLFQSC